MNILFMIGRIIVGAFFLYNAYNHLRHANTLSGYAASKGVPAAKASTIITGIMLLLGGLSVILGVYVGIGLLLLIVFLVASAFMMHAFWKQSNPQEQMMDRIQFMKNIALAGALLIIFTAGTPWPMSLF